MRPPALAVRFRRYLPFTRGVLQEALTYRFRFLFWVLFEFFYVIIAFYLWRGVFTARAVSEGTTFDAVLISGFSFGSMILYVFLERIIASLTALAAENFIDDDIRSGNIAMRLLKPLDYRLQLFFQSLGYAIVSGLIFAGAFTIGLVVVGGIVEIPFSPDFASVLMGIVSIVFGAILAFLTSFSFGLIIFLTLNSFGMWQLKAAVERLLAGSLIPIALFPEWLRIIAQVTPFMQTRYVPVMFFLGTYDGDPWGGLLALLIQAGWIVVMALISSFAWHRVTRRIVVQGG